MRKTQVILDTSPLVALINKKDDYHQHRNQAIDLIIPDEFS